MSTYDPNRRATLISSDEGWEALYLDGSIYKQYHEIEEGDDRGLYFLAFSETYGLSLDDFQTAHTNERGEGYLNDNARFPDEIDVLLERNLLDQWDTPQIELA